MMNIGVTGMTVTHVLGCGMQKGATGILPRRADRAEPAAQGAGGYRRQQGARCDTVIETAKHVLYTGHIGDGKIFVYDVENVVKVRTGEEGYDALQDGRITSIPFESQNAGFQILLPIFTHTESKPPSQTGGFFRVKRILSVQAGKARRKREKKKRSFVGAAKRFAEGGAMNCDQKENPRAIESGASCAFGS